MKKTPPALLLLWLLFLSPLAARAQYYDRAGDDWIDFGRTYIEFKVVSDGVCRVGAEALTLPAAARPENLRLYYRGREQAFYVENGGDPARFDGADYLEFFGRKADGAEDRFLYRDAFTGDVDSAQLGNEYYALFGDTSHYFLTWTETPRPAEYTWRAPAAAAPGDLPRRDWGRAEDLVFHPRFTYWQGGGAQFSPNYVMNPDYTTGEGYMSWPFNAPQRLTLAAPFARPAPREAPRLAAKFVGISEIPEHKVALSAAGAADTFLIERITNKICEITPSAAALTESVDVDMVPLNNGAYGDRPDNVSLAWLRLRYERRLHFPEAREARFRLAALPETTAVAVTGLAAAPGEAVRLYDLSRGLRITGTRRGDTAFFALPPSSGALDCFVATDGAPAARAAEQLWTDRPPMRDVAAPENAADIILITYPGLEPSARAYAEYRENHPERPLSVEIVYATEIYEEFGYGALTSLAIKRFLRKAWETWTPKPRYVMLWGKSWYARAASATNVPTWGQPASDWRYVTNFYPEAPDHAPKMAIGRLDLDYRDNASGFAYVEKLRAYESAPPAEWRRRGVFLGGGSDRAEQADIRSRLRNWAERYESPPHGGEAVVNQKGFLPEEETLAPKEAINGGAGFVMFFGHSTSQVLDVDLQYPEEYQNYGKTPFILGNGCYSADLNSDHSLAARYVSAPERGAIGYLASSTASYMSAAGQHTSQFMETAFQGPPGRTAGEIAAETARALFDTFSFNSTLYNHVLASNLVGDPALAFYLPETPDPALPGEAAVFGETLREGMKQIPATLRVENRGRIEGQTVTYAVSVANSETGGPREILRDTFQFDEKSRELDLLLDLPQLSTDNVFAFRIFCEKDADAANNVFSLRVSALPDAPIAIAPRPFAATPESRVTLKAALPLDAPAELTYTFELDTAPAFDSPALSRSGPVAGSGVLGAWAPQAALTDSAVYYWRVSAQAEGGAPTEWSVYSFRHLRERPAGWAQARPPQFAENAADGAELAAGAWQLGSDTVAARLRAGAPNEFLVGSGAYAAAESAINWTNYCFLVCELDAETLAPLDSTEGLGHVAYFNARVAADVDSLSRRLDKVSAGNYLALLAPYPLADTWPDSLRDRFSGLGLPDATLDSLQGPADHFCLWAKKGESVVWQVAPNGHNDSRLLETTAVKQRQTGRVFSPRIGPAESWDSLFAKGAGGRGVLLKVWARAEDGRRRLAADSLRAAPGQELAYDLSGLDAAAWPYLELEAALGAEHALKSWHVFYGAGGARPDYALDPAAGASVSPDTAEAGAPVRVSVLARRLAGAAETREMKARLRVETPEGQILIQKDTLLIFASEAEAVMISDLGFAAPARPGVYRAEIELNPGNEPEELYRFNNVWRTSFYARPDTQRPRLRVLLNGALPRDGQIVSPSPVFEARLTDSHPYLRPRDTSAIELYLRTPEDEFFLPPRKLGYARGEVELLADSAAGALRARFAPEDLAPGVYYLEAQGRDASGNLSGELRYAVRFEVVEENTYTSPRLFPNPFGAELRARFELTGAVLPESYVVEFYDAAGRKAARVDLAKAFDLRPGLNETGNLLNHLEGSLPPGVYYYRTTARYPAGAQAELRAAVNGAGAPAGALIHMR